MQWCLTQSKLKSTPPRKVLWSEWQAKQRGVSLPSFSNNFLIITCTKSWMEHSFSLTLFLPQTNTISLFLKKEKNSQCFNYSQEAERGDCLGEAAPPAEHGCLLQPGSLLSPRSPPGGAAETRRAAVGPPRTPGERVLTGQGDDAAEVLVTAHTASSLWGQKRKWRLKLPATLKHPRHQSRHTFLLLRNTLGAGGFPFPHYFCRKTEENQNTATSLYLSHQPECPNKKLV